MNFFELPVEERRAYITQTADHLDVSDLIVEKDLWVCWLLEMVFLLPTPMVFKGGTSLSKGFNLIKRFSEDCDITIDYRHFSNQIEFEKISRSQLKKVSDALRQQLQHYVSETILPFLKDKASTLFSAHSFEITLSEDREQLRFYYPSDLNSPLQGYLRDHVLLEFGIRNSVEPCEKQKITPYLINVVPNHIALSQPMIDVLSPIRTYWEKVTLIHVECNRDRLLATPDRLSRHWYDLFMLDQSWVGKEALLRVDILKDVILYKKAFFNASYAHYDDCLQGLLRLIPEENNKKNLSSDFSKMINAAMFYEPPPSFSNIMDNLKILEDKINRLLNKL